MALVGQTAGGTGGRAGIGLSPRDCEQRGACSGGEVCGVIRGAQDILRSHQIGKLFPKRCRYRDHPVFLMIKKHKALLGQHNQLP